jgi:hypothetical protein
MLSEDKVRKIKNKLEMRIKTLEKGIFETDAQFIKRLSEYQLGIKILEMVLEE